MGASHQATFWQYPLHSLCVMPRDNPAVNFRSRS
jgi:hypothetical protein